MARLCPSDLTPLALERAHESELETLVQLRQKLPSDYLVLHGVHWSQANRRSTSFGEIDFVIVNRSGRIIVIEQKDGALDEDEQGLVKHYPNKSKRVTSQIQRSIGTIRDKFALQNRDAPGLDIDYLIYCPDHRVVRVNAAGIDMVRTVDAAAKDSLADRIQTLLAPGVDDPEVCEPIEDFFMQAYGIEPDVSSYVSSQDQVYTQMVEGLGDVIEKLELEPYRLRVIGAAGAGKSQLTLRYVQRALGQGRKPLLLCFNRPLADRLRSLAPDGVTVDTYYGFCADTARAAGVRVEFPDKGSQSGVWRMLQEQLVAADSAEASKYDCLVVDEGQDFEAEWFEMIQLFLTDDASILWLEDPLQNLRGTEPVPLPGFVTYREAANFRTPQSIGTFIRNVLHVDFVQKNPLPGLGVAVHRYDEPRDQAKLVAHRINELVKRGFNHEDIAVISCRGMSHSLFCEREQIGALPVRRFTGEYTPDGKQVYTNGRIYCDTIYRFKGQQAPAVILVDVDPSLVDNERTRAILYCGMTRATVRLEMLVHSGHPLLPALEKAA